MKKPNKQRRLWAIFFFYGEFFYELLFANQLIIKRFANICFR